MSPMRRRRGGEFVAMADRGYRLEWSGQFEYLQRAKAKTGALSSRWTLLIIFVLIYPEFRPPDRDR